MKKFVLSLVAAGLLVSGAPVAQAATATTDGYFNGGVILDPGRAIYVRTNPVPYCDYRLYNCALSVDSQ